VRRRWRTVLPAVGLILFSWVSYNAWNANRHPRIVSSRYFWWASLRLDTDPANSRGSKWDFSNDDGGWGHADVWIDPGWVARLLVLSALPVFLISAAAITGFGKIGISQLSSFLSLTPALIVGCTTSLAGYLTGGLSSAHEPPAPRSDYRSRTSEY
jgi:hypothetical protein